MVLFPSPTNPVTIGRVSRNVETHNRQQAGKGLRERGQKPYGKIAWRPPDVQYRAIQIPNPRFYTQNREQTGGSTCLYAFGDQIDSRLIKSFTGGIFHRGDGLQKQVPDYLSSDSLGRLSSREPFEVERGGNVPPQGKTSKVVVVLFWISYISSVDSAPYGHYLHFECNDHRETKKGKYIPPLVSMLAVLFSIKSFSQLGYISFQF